MLCRIYFLIYIFFLYFCFDFLNIFFLFVKGLKIRCSKYCFIVYIFFQKWQPFVPCENYTIFSLSNLCVVRGQFKKKKIVKIFFTILVTMAWPLRIFFVVLLLSSQYCDLTNSCAFLEQLMSVMKLFFQ